MTDTSVTGEPQNQLCHDLRAPIINILGFSSELKAAVAKLGAIVATHRSDLPESIGKPISDLIQQDIVLCVNCLASAAQQLDHRIDEFGKGQ